MLPEHCIVPYQPSPLPPGPWLVLAPHPDDETFGLGGSLVRAAESGIETQVAFMTDGALGGQAGDLVNIRKEEARAAAAVLGVGKLHFLDQPDRGLVLSAALVDRLRELIRISAARTVLFPGVMEPHPDHRMTAQLAWRALQAREHANVLAAAYEISVQGPANRLIDISAQAETKRRALACYASQLGENNYEDVVTALNLARSYTLPPGTSHAEALYCYSEEERNSGSSLKALTLRRIACLF